MSASGDFPLNIIARSEGFDTITRQIAAFSDALNSASSTIQNQITQMQNLGSAYGGFASAAEAVPNELGNTVNALNEVSPAVSSVSSSLDSASTQFSNFDSSMESVGTTASGVQSSISELGPALSSTATDAITVSNSMQNVNSSMGEVGVNTSNVANEFNSLNPALSETSISLGNATGEIQNLNSTFEQTNISLGEASSSVQNLGQSFTETNVELGNASGSMQKVEGSTKSLSSQFTTAVAPLTALVGSGIMLYQTYDSMQSAQIKVLTINSRLATSTSMLDNATKAYNEAVAKYGVNSTQAAEKLSALQGATERYTANTEKAKQAQEQLNLAHIQFAQNIIPSVLAVGGSLGSLFGALKSKIDPASAALKETGSAASGMSASFGGMSSTLIPLTIAIAAVSAVLIAVKTNAFGFRDALSNVGSAIGNAVPILQPLLNGIKGLAQQFGLTDASAEQATATLNKSTSGFANMGNLWTETVNNMKTSNDELTRSAGQTADELGKDIPKALTDLQTQVNKTGSAFDKFANDIKNKDYKSAVDDIVKAFSDLPGSLKKIFDDAFKIDMDIGKGIDKQLGILGGQIKEVLGGIGTEGAKRLFAGIEVEFALQTKRIDDIIVQPITKAVNSIPDKVNKVGGQIWTALGLDVIYKDVVTFATNVAEGISNLYKFVTDIPDQVWKALNLAGMLSNVVTLATNISVGISNLWNLIKPITTDVWKALKLDDMTTAATKLGKDIVDNITAGIKDALKTVGGIGAAAQAALGLGGTAAAAAPAGEKSNYQKYLEQSLAAQTPPTIPQGADNAKGSTSTQAFEQQANGAKLVMVAYQGQTTAISENTAAQNINTDASGKAIVVQSALQVEIKKLKDANTAAKSALDGMNNILSDSYGRSVLFAQGVLQQQKSLQDLQRSIEVNKGAISEYNKELGNGAMQTAQFATGQQKVTLELDSLQAKTASTIGEISQLGNNLSLGTEQTAQFASGAASASLKILQFQSQTANLEGQFKTLGPAINTVQDAQAQLSRGMAEGNLKFTEFIQGISKAKGEYVAYNAQLVTSASQYITAGVAARASTKDLEQFIGVMKGSPTAIEGMNKSLSSFSDTAVSSIAKAIANAKGSFTQLNEGASSSVQSMVNTFRNNEVGKAIEELEKSIGQKLSTPLKQTLVLQANVQESTTAIQADLGMVLANIKFESPKGISDAIDLALTEAKNAMQTQGDALKPVWASIIGYLNNIKLDPNNTQNVNSNLGKIQLTLATLNNPTANVSDLFGKLGSNISTTGTAIDTAEPKINTAGISTTALGTAIGGTGNAAITASPQLQTFANTIAGFGTIENVAVQVFSTGIPNIIRSAATLISSAIYFALNSAGVGATFDTLKNTVSTIFGTDIPGIIRSAATSINSSIYFALNSAGVSASFDTLKNTVSTVFGTGIPNNIRSSSATISTAISSVFTSGNIDTTLRTLVNSVYTTFNTAIPNAVSASIPTTTSAFAALPAAITPVLGQITTTVGTVFGTGIPAIVSASISSIVSAFSVLPAAITPILGQITTTVSSIFGTGIPAIVSISVNSIAISFSTLPSKLAPIFGQIATLASSIFTNIETNAGGVATAINNAFSRGVDDAIGYLNTLNNTASSVFSAITSNVGSVASALNSIGTAASGAISSVNALGSAINALQNKTVTITTNYVSTGTAAPAAGATASANLAPVSQAPTAAAGATYTTPVSKAPAAAASLSPTSTVGLAGRTATTMAPGSHGQFGINTIVDRPTLFLAGEGAGKEHVIISPSLMNVGNNTDKKNNNSSTTGKRQYQQVTIPISFELNGQVLMKRIIKLVTDELNSVGVYS